ncbi:DEAD/DEAH box helicase [Nitrososphaera viennensis]|uniref:Superfamily II helicase n=2 Tax=Nitrososphaera viennensis TaxID=1034015 RepID=A0A060HFZ3_9ARCH|nr:DEAD/DEAH box helicase [Nitrososphaera viennensis]AIC15529.1 Superfamily II helicase [Nitrososphaera viennensis EN76]UVS70415.1 DEAD/DEAH box helicase [Nitrososphaera viennensis]
MAVKESATTFEELGLDEKVQKALAENGFEKPFPIQEAAIPLILQGKDVIGQAHTGTGKTAAFGLPLLSKVKNGNRQVQALILVPTRELAVQVTGELIKFSKYAQVWTVSVYGGQSFGVQTGLLKRGAHIVVATPGRLIDHIKRGSIKLDGVKFVVLDEADRMLDMGFIDDIEFILSRLGKSGSKDRQTLLFSATMSPEILRLAKGHMREGQIREIRLNTKEVGLDNIEQSYLLVSEQQKFSHLTSLIRPHKEQVIVFAATKRRADKLAANLKAGGFRASAIHGDLSQKERDHVMNRFRRGADSVLVATDIAARGIDVPAVGHVINYDVPNEPETYFHRIGRTARAGAEGTAVSLVSPDRFGEFERILRQTKLPISRLNEAMGIEVPALQQQRGRHPHQPQQHGRSGRNRRNFGGGSKRRNWRRR